MRKAFQILLITSILTYLCLPMTTVQAETLQNYIDLLQKYKNDQSKNQSEINKNEAAIKAAKNEIESSKKEMTKMADEIVQMQQDIVTYNDQIKQKGLETKQLFEYLQLSKGDNLYLEYAFGAETISDLIYRMSVVEQLTKYNNDTIQKLEDMIVANEKRGKQLEEKEKEMEKKQEDLNKRVQNLTGVVGSLQENSVSVSQQVKIYQDIVSSYEKQGCKPQHVIGKDCAVTSSATGWYRPTQVGYVTSEFGNRWGSLHRAIDVSNKNPFNTKIYPVAAGTIKAKYYDSYGALILVIEHRTPSGKYYSSLYAHMSQYAPNLYVGKSMGINDYIGYMGESGFAYGPHLHLEIAPCRLYTQSDSNCGTWNKYVSYMQRVANNGTFKGPRELIYFPKSGVTYNSRM